MLFSLDTNSHDFTFVPVGICWNLLEFMFRYGERVTFVGIYVLKLVLYNHILFNKSHYLEIEYYNLKSNKLSSEAIFLVNLNFM